MKRHYIAISIILGLGLVGLVVILLSAPAATKGGGASVGTPPPDRSDTLHGSSIAGQIVFSRLGRLWRWQGDTAHPLNVAAGNSTIANNQVGLTQPALSRDGAKLAFVRQDESFSDLWLSASDGSAAHALTTNRGNGTPRTPNFIGSSLWAFGPAWSPAGTEIAYLSDVGTDDLTLRATSASKFNQRPLNARLAVAQGGDQRPGWSPLGDEVALAAFDNGKSQIYSIKTANGQSTKLTDQPDGAYDPAWSPDGKLIAFVSRRGNAAELWLMHADGSAATLLTNLNSRNPVWSPDGQKLAFLSSKDSAFELYVLDLTPDGRASGQPRQLSQNARLDGASGFAWST